MLKIRTILISTINKQFDHNLSFMYLKSKLITHTCTNIVYLKIIKHFYLHLLRNCYPLIISCTVTAQTQWVTKNRSVIIFYRRHFIWTLFHMVYFLLTYEGQTLNLSEILALSVFFIYNVLG